MLKLLDGRTTLHYGGGASQNTAASLGKTETWFVSWRLDAAVVGWSHLTAFTAVAPHKTQQPRRHNGSTNTRRDLVLYLRTAVHTKYFRGTKYLVEPEYSVLLRIYEVLLMYILYNMSIVYSNSVPFLSL